MMYPTPEQILEFYKTVYTPHSCLVEPEVAKYFYEGTPKIYAKQRKNIKRIEQIKQIKFGKTLPIKHGKSIQFPLILKPICPKQK